MKTIKVSDMTDLDIKLIKESYGLRSREEALRLLIESFRRRSVLL